MSDPLFNIISNLAPGRPEVEAYRSIMVAARHFDTNQNLVEAVDVHVSNLDHEQLLRVIDYLAVTVSLAMGSVEGAREV